MESTSNRGEHFGNKSIMPNRFADRLGELVHLIQSQEYDQVEKILKEPQDNSSTNFLDPILDHAIQISKACQHQKNSFEMLDKSMQRTKATEKELQTQLINLLNTFEPKGAGLVETRPTVIKSPREFSLRSFSNIYAKIFKKKFNQLPTDQAILPKPLPLKAVESFKESESLDLLQNELKVFCLQTFSAYVAEQLVKEWKGNKSKSIFKYLILKRSRPVQADVLIDLFWQDRDLNSARKNLSQAVYLLRQVFAPFLGSKPTIIFENNAYKISPELNIWLDSEAFVSYYEKGKQLDQLGKSKEAISAYLSADLIYEEDFLLEDIYEDWSFVYRESLKQAHLDLLNRLSQVYWQNREHGQCIIYCRKLLQADNCREDIYRRLMMTYVSQGQKNLALRQYHMCVDNLKAELNVEPMPMTTDLFKKIQKNEIHFS